MAQESSVWIIEFQKVRMSKSKRLDTNYSRQGYEMLNRTM